MVPSDNSKTDYIFGFNAYITTGGGGSDRIIYYSNKEKTAYFTDERTNAGSSLYVSEYTAYQKVANQINTSISATLKTAMANKAKTENVIPVITDTQVNTWRDTYDNKIVKTTQGKYYSIKFRSIPNTSRNVNITNTEGMTETYGAMDDVVSTLKTLTPRNINGNANAQSYKLKLNPLATYVVDIEELIDAETQGTLKTTHRFTDDALYDIYCLPYGEITVELEDTYQHITSIFTSDANSSMNIVNAIKAELGSSIYDIQLLPYCPLRDLMPAQVEGRALHLYAHDEDKVYTFFRSNSQTIRRGILYYAQSSQFSFDINQSISIKDYSTLLGTIDEVTKIKMSNDCDLYRLVSPNFNGQFEFSVAKNGGVDYFNVDCTYKPYMPYIHINPNFKNLYGQDFNDPTGLVCGGNFSIDQVNDPFKEYELQNKNYQQIFDRQLQSLDINNTLNMVEQGFKAGTGTLTGIAGGAVSGFMMGKGGPVGAGIGAAIGGAASLVGGIADTVLLAQRQQEARSLMNDLYSYNLQNIKAIPYSLTKVSALNNNNKIFPFIEYYSCTDEEKKVYKNKIEEKGITVRAIGTIGELCLDAPAHDDRVKWFQGRIIRFNSLYTTSQIAEAINNELQRGVYF